MPDGRRQQITDILAQQKAPISAGALAEKFGVSRQIIVGDIALLRAGGVKIEATPRGYLLKKSEPLGYTATVACKHNENEMREELYIIVDLGGKILDVIVDHPIYGQLTGQLQLASRYDVDEFIREVKEQKAQPLSGITDGIHLHTVNCADQKTFQLILAALKQKGYLYC